MKILFIYNGAENLGIESISSVLKAAGHETALLFDPAVFSGDQLINNKYLANMLSFDKKIVDNAVAMNAQIIGFSCYTGNYQWCLEIARRIKKRCNATIVFGGVHITATGGEALAHPFVDYAIMGEGEYAMLNLVNRLASGATDVSDIQNLCFRKDGRTQCNPPRPYIRDLDSLPLPDKRLFYDKVPMLSQKYLVLTSQGCPFSCTYCSNNMYHQRYCNETNHVRRRSPKHVIQELVYAKKHYDVRTVTFGDDIFTASVPWLKAFIKLYKKKVKLPFHCNVHPLTISDEAIRLLKEGGCWMITMGVQSGSERLRKQIFHRAGSNERILESIEAIKRAGIKISVDNIFGAPTETEEDLKQGYDLYFKAKPDRILTFWLTYYPGTKIIDYAMKDKLISINTKKRIDKGQYSGFAHGTGSVKNKKIAMYQKYQLLFQLRSLVQNDRAYIILSRILVKMPLKGALNYAIVLLNSIKNRDVNAFYLIKYALSKKRVP
ncbi:TPA: B12-binding domain-containing radical SAM protein [Candidatus Woesearchaeota archaeon]|nr:B12-binding domain-containing radical SAM protein [Candidatus Woesearchaeota archaeon]